MTILCAEIPLFADTVHIVSQGETLYSISRKYQITVGELRAANNMDDADVLKSGKKLVIPSADISAAAALAGNPVVPPVVETKNTREYTVQKGDTFYGIARKNGITLPELFALNGLGKDSILKAGQKLNVPSAGSSESGAVPAENPAENADGENTAAAPAAVLPDITKADPRNYTPADKAETMLVWPVKAPAITYVSGKVSGVQLSAKRDEAVTSIRAGTVMYCGTYRGFGQVVFVQSKTGLIYAYTQLGSVNVKKGDYTVFGEKLGTAGIDTISRKSQLTLMVFQNGLPIDPAKAPRG